MEESKFKTRNIIDIGRNVAENSKNDLCIFKKFCILVLILSLLAMLLCSVIYITIGFPWLEVFLRREVLKAVSFFLYSYRIIIFLFSGSKSSKLEGMLLNSPGGDKKGDLAKLLTGPGGELTRDSFLASILFNVKEIHERIAHVDWLYWTMLFIPFYVLYAAIQESFLKLRRNMRYLKDDCRLKSNFINWQNSMHTAMHQRIAELRIEVRTLNTMLDAYRQTVKENQCKLVINNQTDDQEMSNDRHLAVKKNKSDSHIKERKEQPDATASNRGKPRPKTEESKYTSLGDAHRKTQTPAWAEAKKRLEERSKDLMKSRVDAIRAAKEGETLDSVYQSQDTEDGKKILTPTNVLPVEKRIAIARSKFTTKKGRDDSKSLLPKETKVIQHRTPSKDTNIPPLREFNSGTKTRNIKHESSVSATDLLQPQDRFSPITPKKRSLSEAAPIRGTSRSSNPQSDIACPSFVSQDDIVANLGLEGIGRVTSYTEVFKKKVQLTKSGKPPEITIEGRRRWCF